jgi:hypothetical protein
VTTEEISEATLSTWTTIDAMLHRNASLFVMRCG